MFRRVNYFGALQFERVRKYVEYVDKKYQKN